MNQLYEIYTKHKDPVSKIKPASLVPAKKNKYNNKWIEIDNINFQSTGEGYYYLELKDRMRRDEIKGFKRQVEFELVVNGVRVGLYKCDFMVLNHDLSLEVLDFKGEHTAKLPEFLLKEKLMLAVYGVVIKKPGLKINSKKISKKFA